MRHSVIVNKCITIVEHENNISRINLSDRLIIKCHAMKGILLDKKFKTALSYRILVKKFLFWGVSTCCNDHITAEVIFHYTMQ